MTEPTPLTAFERLELGLNVNATPTQIEDARRAARDIREAMSDALNRLGDDLTGPESDEWRETAAQLGIECELL